MVSVDIKNCQPYLSTVFLQPEFWASQIAPGSTLIQLKKIKPNLHKVFSSSPSFRSTINIIRESSKTITSIDSSAHLYKQLVIGGQFYEFFLSELEKVAPGKYDTRDKVKKSVLTLLNCKNTDQLNYEYIPSKVFADLFREMNQILYFIRSSDHSNLGAILQRIESHLVLDVICTRITATNSKIPIFTIHDCIVTTVGNEAFIKQIIEPVLNDNIGAEPSVKYEYWMAQHTDT
jgi:hypothetical protein